MPNAEKSFAYAEKSFAYAEKSFDKTLYFCCFCCFCCFLLFYFVISCSKEMHCCKDCGRGFSTNWELQRHYGKKKKCTANAEKSQTNAEKSFANAEKSQTNAEKSCGESQRTGSKACEFCNKTFQSRQNLLKHLDHCKEKNDPVRILEIKLGKKFPENASPNQCRFCDYFSVYASNVSRHICSCKHKFEYRKLLEEELHNVDTIKSCTINNNTSNITNITNNIIQVNSLGCENTEYLTSTLLRRLWRTAKTDEERFAKTLMIIHGNRDHPENHNIIYKNIRGNVALVKAGTTFEYRNINDIINEAGSNMLDVIIFDTKYDDLSEAEKTSLETMVSATCESELNPKVTNLARMELYNSFKNGEVQNATEMLIKALA